MKLTIRNTKTDIRKNYIAPTLQFEELEQDDAFLAGSPVTEEGPDSDKGTGQTGPPRPGLGAKESDFVFDEPMPEVEYHIDFDF